MLTYEGLDCKILKGPNNLLWYFIKNICSGGIIGTSHDGFLKIIYKFCSWPVLIEKTKALEVTLVKSHLCPSLMT